MANKKTKAKRQINVHRQTTTVVYIPRTKKTEEKRRKLARTALFDTDKKKAAYAYEQHRKLIEKERKQK